MNMSRREGDGDDHDDTQMMEYIFNYLPLSHTKLTMMYVHLTTTRFAVDETSANGKMN